MSLVYLLLLSSQLCSKVSQCFSAVLLPGIAPTLLQACAHHHRPVCDCCSIQCFLHLHVEIVGDSKAGGGEGGGGGRGVVVKVVHLACE